MKFGTSTLRRVVSGTAANWMRIGVTAGCQIFLVPLYLARWDTKIYGSWLLLQAVWSSITILDRAHHDYVGYECLRIKEDHVHLIARIVLSAVPIVFCIALLDFLVVNMFIFSEIVYKWIDYSGKIIYQWKKALILQSITWIFTESIGGLIVRWLTPFGYYPMFAWLGVLYGLVTSIVPAVAVFLGADLWNAAIALAFANFSYFFLFFVITLRILRRKGFIASRPELALGVKQVIKSLCLVIARIADIARQQGVRIVLSPLAGVSQMASFATMRTGANFALQGLNTITSPIMPELMRFLTVRDQKRMESTFGVIWFVLCLALCPGVIVVQYYAPTLFPLWTHGKIVFDPCLFAMFSFIVLVNALNQPAGAVIYGNNILGPQVFIALFASLIAVGGMFFLVPLFGLRGAAFSLLSAELVNLLIYLSVVNRWLRKNAMHWPWKSFFIASGAVIIALFGMIGMINFPDYSLEYLLIDLLLEVMIVVAYWRCLPVIARDRAVRVVSRFIP